MNWKKAVISRILASSGFSGIPGYGTLAITGSLSLAVGVFLVSLSAFVVWTLGFPPWRPARTFHIIFVVYTLAAIAFLLTVGTRDPRVWVYGLAFAGIGLVFAVGQFLWLALKNFFRLPGVRVVAGSPAGPSFGELLASHVSDVHVTRKDEVPRFEGGMGGYLALAAWLDMVVPLRPRYLIISGDVVDSGNPTEWARVEALIFAKLRHRTALLMSPGNHDLCPFYGSPGRHHVRSYFQVQSRFCSSLITANGLRIVEVFDHANREIAHLVDDRAAMLQAAFVARPTLRPAPGQVGSLRVDVDYSPSRLKDSEAIDWRARARSDLVDEWFEQHWYDLFPLRLVDKEGGAVILLLNSVIRGMKTLGASALGRLGEGQIKRVRNVIGGVAPWVRTVVIVMHHAPFRRERGLRDLWREWSSHSARLRRVKDELVEFSIAAHEVQEAWNFITQLNKATEEHPGLRVVLCCGHRHRAGGGAFGRLTIVEAGALVDEEREMWLIYRENGELVLCEETI